MTPSQGGDVSKGFGKIIGETPTPGHFLQQTPGRFGETPTPKRGMRGNKWEDKTPYNAMMQQTPLGFQGQTP